ncbi:elongation factor P [Patescibacteria group bacterium]|nr:elongation factor P [Patescibacteria group bacterium]
MLTYTDLKPGAKIILDGQPYVVLEYSFVRKQQRKPVVQTKIKNLITGQVLERGFYPRDTIEEAETETKEIKYLYSDRGEFWFCQPNNPKERFSLDAGLLGDVAKFLKQNSIIKAQVFFTPSGVEGNEKIIGVEAPIKVELKVKSAPPAVRGNTAQGVTKQVELETGCQLSVPIFINEGDVVRINTEKGEYVERVSKAK